MNRKELPDLIQVTDVRIEPNPAAAGGELEIEITIEET